MSNWDDEYVADQERRAEDQTLREERDRPDFIAQWDSGRDDPDTPDEEIYIITARWKAQVPPGESASEALWNNGDGILGPLEEVLLGALPEGSRFLSQQIEVEPAGPGDRP